MSALHTHFALRNQQAFQRLLEGRSTPQAGNGNGTSGSGGRSWTRPAPLSAAEDVNARDALGRTVLHLACAAKDAAALEYVRLLLAAPGINVNLPDAESHWSALHRALYAGNLGAAILLLQRGDTDSAQLDAEGNTPFDLYNGTVPLAPPADKLRSDRVELLTWGANRNAALGHADGDDRAHPDVVHLRRSGDAGGRDAFKQSVAFRLKPASAVDIRMSRLHTVAVTDEPQNNVRVCGFASTGRLGPGGGQHTQYQLATMQSFEHSVTAVALGQDHTLALTASGTVLSWGLNRFSQLGYVVEAGAKGDEQVQALPKPILGPLKRERVVGVAACKTASACWTESLLYTWGKNGGQLGYDKGATPVQAVPRIVSKVTKPVVAAAMTDAAMAVLLSTSDVILLFNDGHMRVNFPVETMTTSDFHAYRPPHAASSIKIAKIVCSDALFAAVSSSGDMYTFAPPSALDTLKDARTPVRPARVAALRKQWGPVRDAALGADGTIVLCTAAGHMYVRSRGGGKAPGAGGGGGGKAFKFVRVPHTQRVVAVRANETGAFAALRVTDKPAQVDVVGNSISQDFAAVAPYLCFERVQEVDARIEPGQPTPPPPYAAFAPAPHADDDEAADDDNSIGDDIVGLARLWDVLAQDKLSRKRRGHGLFTRPANGADLMIRLQSGAEVPAHALVLSMRCATLRGALGGAKIAVEGVSIKLVPGAAGALPRLAVGGAHPLAVLVLLHYLYSDTLLALGDARVARALAPLLAGAKTTPAAVAKDVERLARALDLYAVSQAVHWVAKRAVPPSMLGDAAALFKAGGGEGWARADVLLRLKDADVRVHSVVLRARSPFFAIMLDDEEWTRGRWGEGRTLEVDLRHLESKYMDYVLRFVCCGEEGEMFERLDFIETADQYIDLLFGVMYAANELLLDRLLLVCAALVLKYVTPHNISAIYTDASSLHCPPLLRSLHAYMASTLETLLDGHLLDELHPRLVKALSGAVRDAQDAHMRRARVGTLVEAEMLMDKHRAWLELEDFPAPIVRTAHARASPKLSPKASRHRRPSLPASPAASPSLRPGLPTTADEDLFTMDDVPALTLGASAVEPLPEPVTPTKGGSPWKAKAGPQRVDMKSILAEAEAKVRPAPVYQPPSKDPSRAAPALTARRSREEFPSMGSAGLPRSVPPTPQTPPRTRSSPHVPTTPPARGPAPARLTPAVPAAPQVAGLGPTINPTKQARLPPGPIARHSSSSGRPWAQPAPQPAPTPATPGALSFAEIQRLQTAQAAPAVRDKRSLKEIQDEERERRQEDEFMRWWAAEEERVREEQEAAVRAVERAAEREREREKGKQKGGKARGGAKAPKAGADAGGAGGPAPARAPRPRKSGPTKAPADAAVKTGTTA